MFLNLHFDKELQILKKQWYIIPFFLIYQLFHDFSTNLVYYNDIQRPILSDSLLNMYK